MPPKFRNDHGLPEIQIGVKELSCVGVSAPHDHPHIYLNMGGAEFIKIVLIVLAAALANKLARIAWSVLRHGTAFDANRIEVTAV